jgi:subtilisin family serine protease
MNPNSKYGRAMMRGNEQFELEKESAYFTAVMNNDADQEKVRSLVSPQSVRKLGQRLLKIKVNPDDRNAAMKKLRSSDANLVCHHAYRLPGKTGTRYYLTDLLIVRILSRVSDPIELFRSHGLALQKECEGTHNTFSVRVTDKAGKNPLKVAHDLIQRPEVVYAEPNLMERFNLSAPSGGINQKAQWHLDQVALRQAWAHTRGTPEVVIAVVDDGCDLSHPAFNAPGKIVDPFDYMDGDGQPWADSDSIESGKHGTPCAGLAVAGKCENGVIGVAPDCGFMPIRMISPSRMEFETINVRDMFEEVGRKADIMSCSWGNVPCYSPLPQPISEVFSKMAVEGGPRGKGTVICFAAGNYNAPIRDDDNHHFEYKTNPKDTDIQIAQTKILNGLAAHPDVIAVGATTSNDQKASYSNWGKELSVCAPSDNYDPISGHHLSGKELFTTDNEAHGDGYEEGESFAGFGGTSGACPIVAGVAGLVRSVRPNLRALQVKAIIEKTADPVTATHLDSDSDRARAGYIAGHSAWFGYGRVNAKNAVEKALLFQ